MEKQPMHIRVKYFNGQQPIEIKANGNWIDLRANEDIFVPKGEARKIPLGIAMELPKGYEAHLLPRSSTFKNFGLIQTNGQGIIDTYYCGDNDEWGINAFCLHPMTMINGLEGTMIHKGDRICQFRIMESQPEIIFETVETLGNADRGGFGSTGIA